MAAKATFEPNKNAIKALAQSSQMLQLTHATGLKGKSYAESISPVDSGEYKDSFRVHTRVVGDRAQTLIINYAPHAVVVELFNHGTGDHVLARTAAYLGR